MSRRPDQPLASRLQSLRAQRLGCAARAEVRPTDGDAEASRAGAPESASERDGRAAVVGLERARRARVRPERELSISSEVDAQARLIRTVQRGLVASGLAWEQLLAQSGVSDHLVASARIRSFRRGVLTIQVRDSSARYELSRFLRAGGEARLARLTPVPLHKVKLVL